MGHQAITVAFGGKVDRANEIVHGKTSVIKHSGSDIFKDIPEKFEATRYHSLIIDKKTCSYFHEAIIRSKFKVLNKEDPCYYLKSLKNFNGLNGNTPGGLTEILP